MRSEVQRALVFIDGTESILVGVETDFRIDDEALTAWDPESDVRPDAAILVIGAADFGFEIAMLGETAALEDITKLLLSPAPTGLGCVPERVHQLRCLCRNTLGSALHRLDMSGE